MLSYPGIILTADEQSDGFSGRQQRHLSYHYHGTGLANQQLGRIGAIEYYPSEGVLNGHMEAQYKYGGLADINELRYSFAGIWTNLGDYDMLDAHGRVASYFWRDGFSVHEKIKYAYDRVHNRMARLNDYITVTDRDEAYQYDKLSRLMSFQRGALPRTQSGQPATVGIPAGKRIDQQSWQLDSAGNWKQFGWQETEGKTAPKLSHTRQHNTVNEITSITGATANSARWSRPKYDDAGNMIRMPDPRSPRDWLRCIYDGWNRLVEVRNRGGNVIANYQHDGLNRRIVKQTKDSEGNDCWRHFFYSPDGQVIEEREASKATELPDFPDRQHFWGADGQLLFSEHGIIDETKNWSAQDERLYVLRDALGSTTALMDTSFLRGRFTYQPYGEPRPLTNKSKLTGGKLWHDFDYLFAGYRYDQETGLYHTRARQYHPLLGVWTRRDPAGYVDGLNLYEYVAGSPTNYIDPSGEALVAVLVVGALVLAGGYITYEALRSDDPTEVYSSAGGGLVAGGTNLADHLTFQHIDALHRYRNQRFDELGISGTWAEYGSDFGAIAAREALIAAATLGLGNFLSAGVQTTTRGVYALARVAHLGLTGYEYGSTAYDLYSGVQAVRSGNPWGWAQIGAAGFTGIVGVRGTFDEIAAGSHGFRSLTRRETGIIAENIARRRLAARLDDLGSLQNRSDQGIDLAGMLDGSPRFVEVKGSRGLTAPRLSPAQRTMARFVRSRLALAAGGRAPRWVAGRSLAREVQQHATSISGALPRHIRPRGYLVEVTNLNRFFYKMRLKKWH